MKTDSKPFNKKKPKTQEAVEPKTDEKQKKRKTPPAEKAEKPKTAKEQTGKIVSGVQLELFDEALNQETLEQKAPSQEALQQPEAKKRPLGRAKGTTDSAKAKQERTMKIVIDLPKQTECAWSLDEANQTLTILPTFFPGAAKRSVLSLQVLGTKGAKQIASLVASSRNGKLTLVKTKETETPFDAIIPEEATLVEVDLPAGEGAALA